MSFLKLFSSFPLLYNKKLLARVHRRPVKTFFLNDFWFLSSSVSWAACYEKFGVNTFFRDKNWLLKTMFSPKIWKILGKVMNELNRLIYGKKCFRRVNRKIFYKCWSKFGKHWFLSFNWFLIDKRPFWYEVNGKKKQRKQI